MSQAAEWRRLGAGEGGLLDRAELAEAEAWLPEAAQIGVDAEILTLIHSSQQAIEQAQAAMIATQQRAAEQAQELAEKAQRLVTEEQRKAEAVAQQEALSRDHAEKRIQLTKGSEKAERRSGIMLASVVGIVILVLRFLWGVLVPSHELSSSELMATTTAMYATSDAYVYKQQMQDMATMLAQTPQPVRETAIALAPTPEVMTAIEVMTAQGFLAAITLVVDLRTKIEYEADHIPGAINIPIAELDQRIIELPNKSFIIFYCDCPNDIDSMHAARMRAEYGLPALVLHGGWNAWRNMLEEGTPVPDN